MKIVLDLLDYAWGLRLRGSGRVSVGAGTRVRWSRIGLKGGGRAIIGSTSIVHCRIDFDSPNGVVKIGDRSFVGASRLVCHTGIAIGNDVIISWSVTIVDHDSHSLLWDRRRNDVADWMRGAKRWDDVTIAPVAIRDKVWIGFGAVILKGVTVGEGAVIGAHSVVTRDVAPYTVVAGNPARVIRQLQPASVRDEPAK